MGLQVGLGYIWVLGDCKMLLLQTHSFNVIYQ